MIKPQKALTVFAETMIIIIWSQPEKGSVPLRDQVPAIHIRQVYLSVESAPLTMGASPLPDRSPFFGGAPLSRSASRKSIARDVDESVSASPPFFGGPPNWQVLAPSVG